MSNLSNLERIIRFYPAFDKRNPDPKKNYGIHGVELAFYLKGEMGTIQFKVSTNWQLPHVKQEIDSRILGMGSHLNQADLGMSCHPMPTDLGYHSLVPQYEGQDAVSDTCEWLDGKPCYYDGSTLNAEPVFEILLREGDEGVWRRLEEYYQQTFSIKPLEVAK